MNQALHQLNIAFVGGGNMGQALVSGLLDSGWQSNCISIIDTDQARCTLLKKQFSNCNVVSEAEAALNIADIVVLAVKPQVMRLACEEIAAQCQNSRPLIISIAAGITIQTIDTWLGGELPIIRCMPNTPALVKAGTTGLFANPEISPEQRETCTAILDSVGTTLWVDSEATLDAVTAISGSGPAYFFYLIEAMIEAGNSLGLNDQQVKQLVVDTASGAAKLLQASGKSPQDLRLSVTSKGGTTEAAINTLEESSVKKIIHSAIKNAALRAEKLSTMTSAKEAN